MNATGTQSGSSLDPLVGRKWKAVINGKRALNGERYSATYTGDIEAAGEDQTIYDVLRELADHLAQVNAEMERPDSYQVTLFPPNNQGEPQPPTTGMADRKDV